MEYLNGSNASVVPSCPQTLEDIYGCGQPGVSPSEVATATRTDTAGSTASESADLLIEKGSNLSRPVSSQLEKAGKSFKEQPTLSRASKEEKGVSQSTRREKPSTGLVNGEADVGHQVRGLVLSEAESDTEWHKAIEGRDCKTLNELLRLKEGRRALLQKTGKAGRTVLHVAAIQGSLELVDTIQGILSSGDAERRLWKLLDDAIDGRCTMTAADIAVHIVGFKFGNVSDDPEFRHRRPAGTNRYKPTPENVNGVQRIINLVVMEGIDGGRYEGLIKSFEENVDYNFCSSEKYGYMFLFHHACSGPNGNGFVEDVIEQCRGLSQYHVMHLMEVRDLQGRTPLHVAVAVAPAQGRDDVLRNLMRCLGSPTLPGRESSYWGVRNSRGWTPFHLAATQPYSDVFGELIRYEDPCTVKARISQDIDKILMIEKSSCTALHLAVLHNNPRFFGDLFERLGGWRHINEWCLPLTRRICFDNECPFEEWTVLSLSLMLGNVDIFSKNYSLSYTGYGRSDWEVLLKPIPICLAAAFGNTEILRLLLDDARLDPLERDSMGRTSLHYAAHGLLEPFNDKKHLTHEFPTNPRRPNTYVCVADVPNVAWLDELHAASLPQERRIQEGNLSARKGCINMLLQAGVDVWQKDYKGKIGNPSSLADDDFISWWHEKIAKELHNMRNNLNQGGNGISVIGALIATASYLGPLQPPLTYGLDPSLQLSPNLDNTGYARVWDLPVRVFMVSNSLSFYLAIASIMLAVVPSLPMPQQAPWEDLQSSRIFLASAICLLLFSVVGILVSYAAASIAVMPEHNVGLTAYPTLVGGFACLIGIVLFITRVLRLIYPDQCREFGRACMRVFRKVCKVSEFGKVHEWVLNFVIRIFVFDKSV